MIYVFLIKIILEWILFFIVIIVLYFLHYDFLFYFDDKLLYFLYNCYFLSFFRIPSFSYKKNITIYGSKYPSSKFIPSLYLSYFLTCSKFGMVQFKKLQTVSFGFFGSNSYRMNAWWCWRKYGKPDAVGRWYDLHRYLFQYYLQLL